MQTWMIVLCRKSELHSIVDEYTDWRAEGVEIGIYSTTEKANHGFLFLVWTRPIPERFLTKLKSDRDILDFFTVQTEPASFPTQPLA
jgi:hypothetical protein